MASVINTNIAATRTHNVYNRNNDYMNAAMTRVATGMKINSAKDGASTWAISEKMRERIRANDQANQNVQNDTAMLKTAEGGIGNTIDILKTLKERAINAANDSNLDSNRATIQQEITQLVAQIDDNAQKVSFNGRTLLNGKADNDTSAPAADNTGDDGPTTTNVDATSYVAPTAAEPSSSTTAADHSVFKLAGLFKDSSSLVSSSNDAKLTDFHNGSTSMGIQAGDKITISWKKYGDTEFTSKELEVDADTKFSDLQSLLSSNGFYLGDAVGGGSNITTDGSTAVQDTSSGTATDLKNGNSSSDSAFFVVATGTDKITSFSIGVTRTTSSTDAEGNVTNTRDTVSAAQTAFAPTAFATAPEPTTDSSGDSSADATSTMPTSLNQSGELQFHVGGEAAFSIGMTFGDLTASGLGVDKIDVSSQSGAKSAIAVIDNALNLALNEQTRVGAYENRLGYTSDNLVTMNENLEAADSAMRDSDIAKEMTTYMKYAVLSQASQYMLAQAGQNAFQVLNLLQQ